MNLFKKWLDKSNPGSVIRLLDDNNEIDMSVDQIYSTNNIIYRCISTIAKNIATVSWRVQDVNKQVVNDYNTLLKQPNIVECKEDFLFKLVKLLLINGSVYIHRTTVQEQENWCVLTHVERRGNYYVSDKIKECIDPITGQSNILPISIGISPCQVARKIAKFHDLIIDHNISVLEKGGRPSGVLTVKTSNANTAGFQQLEEQVREWSVGAKKAGELLVLTNDCTWHEMGLKPIDTNFNQGQHTAARQIAQIFEMPPMIIGIQGDATFSNYREAKLHWWEDSLIPLMKKITAALNVWRFSKDELELIFDFNNIDALELKKQVKFESMIKAGCFSINELRAYWGYDPINDENNESTK